MKILKNKVGEYSMPPINSKWRCKNISDNTHFSRDKFFKIVEIRFCENRGEDRCLYARTYDSYYEKLKDSLKGGNCADMGILYKYEHNGLICRQCYHSFIEGAELTH